MMRIALNVAVFGAVIILLAAGVNSCTASRDLEQKCAEAGGVIHEERDTTWTDENQVIHYQPKKVEKVCQTVDGDFKE